MPRNKYPEETVQKILDVSLKLFLEKGYRGDYCLRYCQQFGRVDARRFLSSLQVKRRSFRRVRR